MGDRRQCNHNAFPGHSSSTAPCRHLLKRPFPSKLLLTQPTTPWRGGGPQGFLLLLTLASVIHQPPSSRRADETNKQNELDFFYYWNWTHVYLKFHLDTIFRERFLELSLNIHGELVLGPKSRDAQVPSSALCICRSATTDSANCGSET